jgi:DNA-binding transcriptional ArsR family regulator
MSTDIGDPNAVFTALADPTRRRIIELLAAQPPRSTNELAAMFPVTRWAVMKHLALLRDAGLVQTLPQGRRRLHYLDRRRFGIAREWIEQFS